GGGRGAAVPGAILQEPHALRNPERVPYRLGCPRGERFTRSAEVTPRVDPVVVGEVHEVPGSNGRQEQVLIEGEVVNLRGVLAEPAGRVGDPGSADPVVFEVVDALG